MTKKLYVICYCLLVIGLIIPSILPLFRSDFFKMHDYTHVARLYEMDKALKDGHFPVRWVADLGWGYGMPLFNFYAPLPYYFAETFHLIGFNFVNSIKICFGSTFFIAFIGMYLLSYKFWGKWGAILSALAFVYSPYRSVDFYVRGALGELFAISLIPLAIWSIFELIDKKTFKNIAIASLTISALFLSHTVLTLIAIPTLLIIGIFYIFLNKNKLSNAIKFIFSFLLAIGLSSFFLLPAFFEKQFTKVGELTQGFSYYGHHFLYFRQYLYGNWGYGGSVDSIPDGMSFHLGKVHLLLAIIGIVLALIYFIKQKKVYKNLILILFFISFGVIFAFLATYNAKFIWDKIPIMAYIQFPWRFNSFIIVFLAFLTGGSVYYFSKLFKSFPSLLFLAISIIVILNRNNRYFKPEGYINAKDLYYTDEQLIKKNMSGVIPDYIPIWVRDLPNTIQEQDYQIISGDPKIDLLESKTQKIKLSINNISEATILINRFYFPGWQVESENKKIEINYKENNGLMQIALPIGQYHLDIKFTSTPIRIFANTLSLISLIIIGGIVVYRRKKI